MDLLRAGLIEDPYYEMNSLKCEWVPQRWWMYRTSYTIPEELRGRRIRLVLRGIDYKAHIYFNKMPPVEHEGMYTHVTLDVTDYAVFGGDNTVQVVIESAPDEMGQIGFTSRTFTQKSRFNYKWDFATRLINLGLYDSVYFEAVGDATIESSHIRYADNKVTYSAEIGGAEVGGSGKGALRAELKYCGETVSSAESGADDTLELAVARGMGGLLRRQSRLKRVHRRRALHQLGLGRRQLPLPLLDRGEQRVEAALGVRHPGVELDLQVMDPTRPSG
jgi:beta-mannosidase